MNLPTDLEILNAIYERYYATFQEFTREEPSRNSKIHVPIDCVAIADELGVDRDIVFGRLYYHLNHLYGYKHEDGVGVDFFNLRVGKDVHCVNFPLLASVLAGLREDDNRQAFTRKVAWISLGVAVASIVISAVFR